MGFKTRMKTLRILLIVSGLLLLFSPVSVYAFQTYSGINCTNAASSTLCSYTSHKTAKNVLSGPDSILAKATNLIAYIGGIAAAILIIVGSIKFVVSGGNAEDVESAKRTIMYSLIGVVIIVIAKLIVNYVVARG